MKSLVSHVENASTGACLGIHARVWCVGCDKVHLFVFACPEHGKPFERCWEGDPYSDPPDWPPTPTSSNSLKTTLFKDGKQVVCHSYIKNGQWEYLSDCTAHDLRGFVPMVDLPDWLVKR